MNLKTKWYACYHHGNHDFLNWSSKNWQFDFNHWNPVLKTNFFFETDSCLLALTTFTSNMQSCFKIDLGLIKLSNVKILCLQARVFLVTIMKWGMSGQDISNFQDSYCLKAAASTIQKINPVGCFNYCHWRLVYIHLFPVIWRKSSKSDFQSWKKNSSTISLLFCKMIA